MIELFVRANQRKTNPEHRAQSTEHGARSTEQDTRLIPETHIILRHRSGALQDTRTVLPAP
eukprot:1192674-Prorocentrum_minimum.AAC.1